MLEKDSFMDGAKHKLELLIAELVEYELDELLNSSDEEILAEPPSEGFNTVQAELTHTRKLIQQASQNE